MSELLLIKSDINVYKFEVLTKNVRGNLIECKWKNEAENTIYTEFSVHSERLTCFHFSENQNSGRCHFEPNKF